MCLLCVDECVYEVDRVSVYSGLSGRATETVAPLWIFKEPNLLLNSLPRLFGCQSVLQSRPFLLKIKVDLT